MDLLTVCFQRLDFFLAQELRNQQKPELFRARVLAGFTLLSMLTAVPALLQELWMLASYLLVSGCLILLCLRFLGKYKRLPFVFSLGLILVAFVSGRRHGTIFTGQYFWNTWIIVYVGAMDGIAYALACSLCVLAMTIILLYMNSHEPLFGIFSNYDELASQLVMNGVAGGLQVALILLVFAVMNEQMERHTQRQHMMRAQTMHKAAIGDLVGQLAHEVNNPLAVIHAAVLQYKIMTRKYEMSPEKRERLLLVIQESLQRLSVVVDGLKAFTGTDAEQQPSLQINLRDVLNWSRPQMESLARSSGVTLIWPDHDDQYELHGRPGQLGFILGSLIHEAIEESHGQGVRRVVMQVRRTDAQQLELHIRYSNRACLVRRRGPGLSVCRKLAEEHGGSLQLRWQPYETSLVLQLPGTQGGSGTGQLHG